jgi:hypothetical protein
LAVSDSYTSTHVRRPDPSFLVVSRSLRAAPASPPHTVFLILGMKIKRVELRRARG